MFPLGFFESLGTVGTRRRVQNPFQLGQRHAHVRTGRKDRRALDEVLKLPDDLKEALVFLTEVFSGQTWTIFITHGRQEYLLNPMPRCPVSHWTLSAVERFARGRLFDFIG